MMSNQAPARYEEFLGHEDTFVIPDEHPAFFGAHLARYRFACTFARNKNVLDVGSGSGYGTRCLAAAAASVVGIDASDKAVALSTAAPVPGNARFARMDARTTTFADGEFDLVTCFEVIEHVDGGIVPDIIREARRCLRPGGLALFSTPNIDVVERAGAHVPDFHINNLNALSFEALLAPHFDRVDVWGQRLKGNPIYDFIRAVDVLGLRYRAYNALDKRAKVRAYAAMGVDDSRFHSATDYQFSRWFVARAGMLFALCRR
jgi:2-polyprenyl-3-methyl-5-hydroxy-6-metoxy-1,4-benzoquinol methylase